MKLLMEAILVVTEENVQNDIDRQDSVVSREGNRGQDRPSVTPWPNPWAAMMEFD